MSRPDLESTAKNVSPIGFYMLPVLLGGVAGLLSILQSGINFFSIGIAVILPLLGGFIGMHLFGKCQAALNKVNLDWGDDERSKLDDINAYASELEQLCLKVMPILLRQIQTSRTHTEQEITVLTSRFASMCSQLEQIISGTGHNTQSNRSVDELFIDSQNALKAVLHVLLDIQTVEHQVVEEVRKLSSHTQNLDSMAQEVRKVAEQINLLALNAAIEAARAGENGRGFAVVADEVRKLAGFSSSTGERISRAINEINSAMDSALKMSEQSGTEDDKAISNAENSIRLALADLRVAMDVFKGDAEVLRSNSTHIRDEIYSVLAAFQFQDRVSQMLTHVEHNLSNLHGAVDSVHSQGLRHQNSLNIEKVLSSMELVYTMPEELINHSSSTSSDVAKNDDLTFF